MSGLLLLSGPPVLLALPAPAGADRTLPAMTAEPVAPVAPPGAGSAALAFEDDFTHLPPPDASPKESAAAGLAGERAAMAPDGDEIRLVKTIEAHAAPPPTAPPPWAPAERLAPVGTAARSPLEPDPWSIMPARTLRRAGHHHLVRQQTPEDPADDLLTQAERERRPRPERAGPPPAEPLPAARHDLLILPSRPDFRASDQGVKALILWLDRSQLLRGPNVSSLEEFVGHPDHLHAEAWRARMLGGPDRDGQLIRLDAGLFAHQLFVDGEAPRGPPVVLSGLIGHRVTPGPLPFGPPGLVSTFWLALIGCRFPRVSDAVLARLHDILHLRPRQLASPHLGPPAP